MSDYEPREKPMPKQLGVGEIPLSREQEGALKGLVGKVESRILSLYDLDGENYPSAVDFLWLESDEKLKELTGKESLNPRGGVITYTGKEGYGSVLYLAPALRERLAYSTDASRLSGHTQELEDFITLIEETSHFIYINYCMKNFEHTPEAALTELIAVIDQFMVVEGERENSGFSLRMPQGVVDALFRDNAAKYKPEFLGATPAAYIIGHRLGVDYWNYLSLLSKDDRLQELRSFYRLNHGDQLEYLFYNLGLDVYTYSEFEGGELAELFKKLGLNLNSA